MNTVLVTFEIDLLEAVHRAGERLCQRRKLGVDSRRSLECRDRGHRHVLTHAAVFVLTEQSTLAADVIVTRETEPAGSSPEQRFDAYEITFHHVFDIRTDRGHGPRKLMPGSHPRTRGEVAAVEVQVGAADARAAHPQLNLPGPGGAKRSPADGEFQVMIQLTLRESATVVPPPLRKCRRLPCCLRLSSHE